MLLLVNPELWYKEGETPAPVEVAELVFTPPLEYQSLLELLALLVTTPVTVGLLMLLLEGAQLEGLLLGAVIVEVAAAVVVVKLSVTDQSSQLFLLLLLSLSGKSDPNAGAGILVGAVVDDVL